jgi:hypothetical protein
MPNVWDENNVKENLKTLSLIRRGEKLSVPDASGRYRRQDPGIVQKVTRTITGVTRGETIRNDDQFLTPLTKLFETAARLSKAVKLIPGGVVTVGDIDRAIEGLRRLQQSYSGKDKEPQRAKLKDIIAAAETAVQQELKGSEDKSEDKSEAAANDNSEALREAFATLKEQHGKRVTFQMMQDQIVAYGDTGMCKALCIDWIRRKLFLNKDSYADSGKEKPADALELRVHDNLRMQKKVDHRIREIQATVRQTPCEVWDGPINMVETTRLRQFKGGFDQLEALLVAKGPTKQVICVEKRKIYRPEDKEGYMVFKEIYSSCRKEALVYWSVSLNKEVICREKVDWGCYVIDLEAVDPRKGHSVALHLTDDRIHFFDPNLGEFEFFPQAEDEAFYHFGELWWLICALSGATYHKWTILKYRDSMPKVRRYV